MVLLGWVDCVRKRQPMSAHSLSNMCLRLIVLLEWVPCVGLYGYHGMHPQPLIQQAASQGVQGAD